MEKSNTKVTGKVGSGANGITLSVKIWEALVIKGNSIKGSENIEI